MNDGFMKVFQRIKKYDRQRPFKPWFTRVLINTAIDHFKKKEKYAFDKIVCFEPSSFCLDELKKEPNKDLKWLNKKFGEEPVYLDNVQPLEVEDIIKNMKKDDVDMASGIIENEITKSPRGSGRIFTKKAMECLDWKYQPNYGYETYALFKIQSEGMKARVYPIITKTQRPTGTNYNKKKFYHMGFSYKALGYTSFYSIGRGLTIAKKYGLYNGLMFSIGFFSNRNVTYNEKICQYCKKNLEHSWEDLLYKPKQLLKKLTTNGSSEKMNSN